MKFSFTSMFCDQRIQKSVFGSWWERCRRRRKFYGSVCSDSFFFSHETAIQFALEPQRVKEPILWLFDFELFWSVFGTVRKTNKLEKQIVSKQTLFIKKIVFHFLLFWDRVSERPSRLREVHHLTSSPKCWWRGENLFFKKQCFARSLLDTIWGYFQLMSAGFSLKISWKYFKILSSGDRAKHCFKNEKQKIQIQWHWKV